MVVTPDRAAGTVRLAIGDWSEVIPRSALRGRLELYRGLWGRGSKTKGGPGPWAGFYEQNVQVLTAALRDVEAWQDG